MEKISNSDAFNAHKKLRWAIWALYITIGWVFVSPVLFVFVAFFAPSFFKNDPAFLIYTVLVGILSLLYAIIVLFAVRGLKKRQKWTRNLGIGIGIMNVLGIPSVIFAIFILIALLDKHIKKEFDQQKILFD